MRRVSKLPVSYAIQADRSDRSQKGDPVHYAGWFLDFPMAPDPLANPGERVTGRVTLRSGKAVVASLVPEQTLCNSGGSSWIYILNGCDGSKPKGADDAYPFAKRYTGHLLAPPVIVKDGRNPHLDRMILPDLSGGIIMEGIKGEAWGQAYWWQNID